jgi:hypothetical protein
MGASSAFFENEIILNLKQLAGKRPHPTGLSA